MSDLAEVPTGDTLDQIDSLIAGQYNEGELVVDAEPTDDTPEPIKDAEAANTEPEPESEDIPEKDEADELEGDLETEEDVSIDYDLSIPQADGRDAMTIGEMKDSINQYEREKGNIESQRMDLIKQETELNQYMQHMGVQVPPEFHKHMAKQQEQYLEGQHKQMLKMMPEVKDKVTFDSMRAGIVGVAKASNFSEKEVSEIGDARVIHLLNRLAKFEAKELKSQETVSKLRGKKPLRSVKPQPITKQSRLDKQVQHATESSDRNVKDAAIKALLG